MAPGSSPRRKSNRLGGYDYSLAGAYFVTIVTQGRQLLFGEVVGEAIQLNPIGEMVSQAWREMDTRYTHVELDEFVVMPNHFHGIVVINETNVGAGLVPAHQRATTRVAPTQNPVTLGEIIGAFKSITTNNYIEGVEEKDWPPFDRRLWQRNYHERIIRNEDELHRIREYVHYNPLLWAQDEENPDRAEG